MKQIKNKIIKTIKLGLIALASLAFSASAQTYVTVPLPATLILTGASAWGTTATTNLANGWDSITATTNITQAYNKNTGVVDRSTNIIYVTNTAYADFFSASQPYVVLQSEWTCSAGTSNIVYEIRRSLTQGRFSNGADILLVTNDTSGTTTRVAGNTVDMRGFPFGRITKITYQSTATGERATNNAHYATGPDVKQWGKP